MKPLPKCPTRPISYLLHRTFSRRESTRKDKWSDKLLRPEQICSFERMNISYESIREANGKGQNENCNASKETVDDYGEFVIDQLERKELLISIDNCKLTAIVICGCWERRTEDAAGEDSFLSKYDIERWRREWRTDTRISFIIVSPIYWHIGGWREWERWEERRLEYRYE